MGGRFLLWRDKGLLLALALFFLDNSTFVRVTLRSLLEGPNFQWGYFAGLLPDGDVAMASGRGLFGHAEFILAECFIVLLLIIMGLRRPDRLFAFALFAWCSASLCISAWVVFGSNEPITVSKETLGVISLPAGWTLVAWPAAAWIAAAALLVRTILHGETVISAQWTGINTALLFATGAVIAVSGVLLNLGQQHGQADFLGIGLIYLALMLMVLAFAPWAPKGVTAPQV